MITADVSFLDRLRDRASQPVNPQQLRCGGSRARSAAMCPALTVYRNAGHGKTHLRIALLAFIGVHL